MLGLDSQGAPEHEGGAGECRALKVSRSPVGADSRSDMHMHFCEVNALRRLAARPCGGLHAAPAVHHDGLVGAGCACPLQPAPGRSLQGPLRRWPAGPACTAGAPCSCWGAAWTS